MNYFCRRNIVLLLLLTIQDISGAQNNDYEAIVRIYIDKFKDIAISEMKDYGIPASITLAQGILESNAGRSKLATEANNHFGIKCHTDWQGATYIQDDETKNECFRKYDSPEESFRDHSLFLTTRDRYKMLFDLDINDYAAWANGLRAAGYATNPQYPEKLISTIERFSLQRYDTEGAIAWMQKKNAGILPSAPPKYELFAEGPAGRDVYVNNGLQFIIYREHDNMAAIANDFGIKSSKISKWNDLESNAHPVPGQMLYIEPKKRKSAEFESSSDLSDSAC